MKRWFNPAGYVIVFNNWNIYGGGLGSCPDSATDHLGGFEPVSAFLGAPVSLLGMDDLPALTI